MKFTGRQLGSRLSSQPQTVLLVMEDGREFHNLSPRYVAGIVRDGDYTGYAKNGVITAVIAQDTARRRFAMRDEIAEAAAGIPLAPRVWRNHRGPGAKHWIEQPAFARTGHGARVITIFRETER